MIPGVASEHLQELHELTTHLGQRMRAFRHSNSPAHDAIFTLYVVDEDRSVLLEVTTKNLDSGAAWILDQYRRVMP